MLRYESEVGSEISVNVIYKLVTDLIKSKYPSKVTVLSVNNNSIVLGSKTLSEDKFITFERGKELDLTDAIISYIAYAKTRLDSSYMRIYFNESDGLEGVGLKINDLKSSNILSKFNDKSKVVSEVSISTDSLYNFLVNNGVLSIGNRSDSRKTLKVVPVDSLSLLESNRRDELDPNRNKGENMIRYGRYSRYGDRYESDLYEDDELMTEVDDIEDEVDEVDEDEENESCRRRSRRVENSIQYNRYDEDDECNEDESDSDSEYYNELLEDYDKYEDDECEDDDDDEDLDDLDDDPDDDDLEDDEDDLDEVAESWRRDKDLRRYVRSEAAKPTMASVKANQKAKALLRRKKDLARRKDPAAAKRRSMAAKLRWKKNRNKILQGIRKHNKSAAGKRANKMRGMASAMAREMN